MKKLLILVLCILSSCGQNKIANPDGDLTILDEYLIEVSEPSGLSLSVNRQSLWTVSDQTGKIYNVSFTGELINTLSWIGDDPEGIYCNPVDGSFYIVEERTSNVVHLNSQGTEINRFQIDTDGSENSGPEGIAVRDGQFFILNEKSPAQVCQMDATWQTVMTYDIGFADISGICYDATRSTFWLVSDQARTLFSWTPEAGVNEVYDLGNIDKAEGVAVSSNGIVRIVSDSTSRLYVLQLDS
jgi:uncharacterized protein YjiK